MPCASEIGRWDPRFDSEIPAMHMHLLPTGKVLYWGLDSHGKLGIRRWDPRTGQIEQVPPPPFNVFSSGHAFLPDGRLLVAGGHEEECKGLPHACLYDPFAKPATNPWSRLPDMNDRRWCPSCLTLDTGEVLVVSGHTIRPTAANDIPQVWQPTSGSWRSLVDARLSLPLYPWLHLTPEGEVFLCGPDSRCRFLNPRGTGSWRDGPSRDGPGRQGGTSVMYAPGQLLVMGGGFPGARPVATSERIDLGSREPAWQSAGEMANPRRYHNAESLADGSVLVTGGTTAATDDDMAGKVDPGTYRGYLSTALLLPDARVLSGGGKNPPNPHNASMEIFWPPYLFKPKSDERADRTNGSARPQTIVRATMLRLGSVTHSVNMGQRFLEVELSQKGENVRITAPANSRLAPPGYYLLFLINTAGVPSEAEIIQLK